MRRMAYEVKLQQQAEREQAMQGLRGQFEPGNMRDSALQQMDSDLRRQEQQLLRDYPSLANQSYFTTFDNTGRATTRFAERLLRQMMLRPKPTYNDVVGANITSQVARARQQYTQKRGITALIDSLGIVD